MSEDDQVTLNLGNGMSSSSMSAARSLFDEIVNINTKISIMKQQGVESEELSDLRSVRKYMKDRIEFYVNGGCV
ncbi:MAG: hypothetical protein CMK23_06820 [Porticoccaceae bacterium]|jgi:hypothetical protein|nr:hypothetical protein [Porticoccaceae bacterium]|tara:strand:- start:11809 stop:12030 length:222 start_codon:yes stop_codon:yes gene_type:complete